MVTRASVLVPTHRGAHRLPTLLDALARQDVRDPWEVVVAVDGVLDDTPAILSSYASRLPLRVLTRSHARGVCAALNDAYAAATGDVLIRCDDDLTPAPGMVRRHVAWHERSSHPVGVIGATRDVFEDTPYARAYGRPANARQLAGVYRRAPDRRWLHWAAHNSLTRESWDLVGGFDPRFAYGEDVELGWRLHDSGVEIVIDPELEIPHRGPATCAQVRAPRAFVSGSGRRLLDEVHRVPAEASGPVGLAGRVWSAGTTSLALAVRSPKGYRRLGSLADRLPGAVPDAMRGRAIAFVVEAAGRSGQRHGSSDLGSFRSQKSLELSTERPGG